MKIFLFFILLIFLYGCATESVVDDEAEIIDEEIVEIEDIEEEIEEYEDLSSDDAIFNTIDETLDYL